MATDLLAAANQQPSVLVRMADWQAELPATVFTDVEDATRKPVEFDKYAQVQLASDSPSLGSMTAILLRTEAASSSQIEQLTTSAKQLALAEIAEGEKINALSVVGNVRAMEAALGLAEDISVETIFAMHKALMRHQAGFEQGLAGRFRKEQVWIGPGNAGPWRRILWHPITILSLTRSMI